MKKLTQYITPGLMAAAMLLAPAMAYRAAAQDPAAAPTQEDKDCEALYNSFTEKWTIKGGAGQKDAYPIGKEYLTKCGQRENEFTAYVKKQVAKYEEAMVPFEFDQERHKGVAGDPAVIYKNGRILLAKTPDDIDVMMAMAYYGAAAFEKKDTTYKADAIDLSKKAIAKLESGAVPKKWDPFISKDQALGWLNHGLGALLIESSPAEAQGYFFKSNTSSSSDLPKGFDLFRLAVSYDLTQVEPAKADYVKYDKQPVSPESEAAKTKYFQVTDRAIDYYARALAAMGTDPKLSEQRAAAKEVLTAYYKFRHPEVTDVDSTVNSYVSGVNKTPMPDPKSPLPELPKPATPATTGATTTGAASSTGATGGTGVGNGAPANTAGGSKPTMTTGSPAPAKAGTTPPAAAPKPAPAMAKPPTKMKRNHRTN